MEMAWEFMREWQIEHDRNSGEILAQRVQQYEGIVEINMQLRKRLNK